jgi:hypothetical protein
MNQVESLVSKSIDERFAEFIKSKDALVVGDHIIYPDDCRDVLLLSKTKSDWYNTERKCERLLYEILERQK